MDSYETGWRQQKIYNYLIYTKECLVHSSSGIRIPDIYSYFKSFGVQIHLIVNMHNEFIDW